MEFKQIQELIKAVNKSNLTELKIEDGEFKLTIKQGGETKVVAAPAPQPIAAAPAPAPQPAAAPAATPAPAAEAAPAANDNTVPINAPIIGTFYRKPSPDKPPFVQVGDIIEVGQVVCIIEAMKIFNEIESEVAGKVVEVLVKGDNEPVEYDQPLFRVEPV